MKFFISTRVKISISAWNLQMALLVSSLTQAIFLQKVCSYKVNNCTDGPFSVLIQICNEYTDGTFSVFLWIVKDYTDDTFCVFIHMVKEHTESTFSVFLNIWNNHIDGTFSIFFCIYTCIRNRTALSPFGWNNRFVLYLVLF
jgi:hypothetical protein